MFQKIKTIKDVVDWGLCMGCGACHYACGKSGVELIDIESDGIRPKFDPQVCAHCVECLEVCPGYTIDSRLANDGAPSKTAADHEFGPALEMYEGYAADEEIRFNASSGGLLTALALFCLEHEGMKSTVHVASDEDKPWTNRTVQSFNRGDLLRCAGSRYAPSSPCQGLAAIERSDGPCVFIGKPCDTAGAFLARRRSPGLDRNLGLVLSFFCAGAPSTRGTLDLAESFGVPAGRIASLRYRGQGWPGEFKVTSKDTGQTSAISYMDSWKRLTKHRPFRCNLCPDGLGRIADITCGDAWSLHNPGGGDPGRSVALVRTERGREILHRAMKANYVVLQPVSPSVVLESQVNLLERRRLLFGRGMAMRLFGAPTPKAIGFSLFHGWIGQPFGMKARSILGTARRVVQRGLWKRRKLDYSAGTTVRELE